MDTVRENPARAIAHSSVGSNSSSLYSSALWGRAMDAVRDMPEYQSYCNLLKHGDARLSAIASPREIERVAAGVRESATKSRIGKSGAIRGVLDEVIKILAEISDVGTTIVALNPYASVAWGALQFFIQAAVNDRQIRSLCWDNLQRMTYLVSKYQTFEKVYSIRQDGSMATAQLEDALVQLYTSILRYQVVIVNYAGSRVTRIKASLHRSSDSIPQKVLDDIREQEVEVLRIQATLDREIDNANFELVLGSTEELKVRLEGLEGLLRTTNSNLDLITDFVKMSIRDDVLKWISPIKYENHHNSPEKTALSGTGQWLLKHDTYVAWFNCATPTVLWLHGFMGCGKSCLAHAVVEHLKGRTSISKSDNLLFFYCVGTDTQSRKEVADVEPILRSFVKQLASNNSLTSLQNTILELYNQQHHKSDLSKQQCLDLIRNFFDGYAMTTLILDGLDECPLEVQQGLITSLQHCTEESTGLVKICISSRFTPIIDDLLNDWNPVKIDVAANNTSDIRILIRRTIEEAASTPGLRKIYAPEKGAVVDLKNEAFEKLDKLAQGMFRWVHLALKFLHHSPTSREFRKRLERLDHLHDLFDLYDAIYDDMMKEEDSITQAVIKTVLVFLLHGESPSPQHHEVHDGRSRHSPWAHNTLSEKDDPESAILHILEAATFVETGSLEEPWYTAEQLVALCPSFISLGRRDVSFGKRVRHRASSTLSIPHFSVREYLTANHSDDYSFASGHAYLATLCMSLFIKLEIDDFSRFNRGFARYAALYWIRHLLRLKSSGDQIEKSLLQIKSDEAFRKALNDFLLESHVTKAFLTWTTWMRKHERLTVEDILSDPDIRSPASYLVAKPPSSMFARILLDVDWSSFTLVCDARASRTFATLARLGINVGPDEKPGLGDPSILPFAVFVGNTDAINFLVQGGLSLTETDSLDCSPFHYVICRKGISTWHANDLMATPQVEILKALYQNKTDRQALIDANKTCLFMAAQMDDVEPAAVQFLLDSGADITITEGEGIFEVTALDIALGARGYRNEAVVEALLPAFLGREVDSRFFNRLLWNAVVGNSPEDIVKKLIENGADPAHLRGDSTALEQLLLEGFYHPPLSADYLSPLVLSSGKIDPQKEDRHGRTMFHTVIRFCTLKTISLWIEHGADPYIKTKWKRTPIEVARRAGREDIVEYLSSIPPKKPPLESESYREAIKENKKRKEEGSIGSWSQSEDSD